MKGHVQTSFWNQQYQALLKFKRRTGHCRVPEHYSESPGLAKWLARQCSLGKTLPLDRLEKLYASGVRFPGVQGFWIVRFFELKRFRERKGHCHVPCQQPSLRSLGKWVTNQRILRRNGKLSLERHRLLNAIGFAWGYHDFLWERRLNQLKALLRDCGTEGFSRTLHSHDLNLARWFWRRWRSPDKLTPQQRRQLTELGVPPPKQRDLIFKSRLKQLKRFKSKHDHCDVSIPDDPSLAHWLIWQRSNRDRLPTSRRRALDRLGITWDPLESAWEVQYQILCDFRRRHEHCEVLPRNAPNKRFLLWVHNQKATWRQGRLRADRRQRLERLGFIWKLQQSVWDKYLTQLETFRKRFGHCDIRSFNTSNERLLRWVEVQRRAFHQKLLQADRRRRLERLGFIWDVKQSVWDERLTELQKFRKRFGHCDVRLHNTPNKKFLLWIGHQRAAFRLGRMQPDRQQQLDQLGFVWDVEEVEWNKRVAQLQAFQRQFGHFRISARSREDVALRQWMYFQRRRLREGKIDPRLKAKLNAIGFAWNAR